MSRCWYRREDGVAGGAATGKTLMGEATGETMDFGAKEAPAEREGAR